MDINISTPKVRETLTKHCLLVNQIKKRFAVRKNCCECYEGNFGN